MEELFAPGLKPWKAHAVVMGRVHEVNARRAEEGKAASSGTNSMQKSSMDQVERK